MAKKQDFSKINTQDIYSKTITAATEEPKKNKPRKTYTDKEAAELSNELKTSGRKGLKLPRINLAFSPEIYDYVKTMSRASGQTYTEFLDGILQKHKAEHAAQYAAIIKLRESL